MVHDVKQRVVIQRIQQTGSGAGNVSLRATTAVFFAGTFARLLTIGFVTFFLEPWRHAPPPNLEALRSVREPIPYPTVYLYRVPAW